MNICFQCNEYPPLPHGGIGSVTQLMGRALVRRGHNLRVVGVYPKAESVRREEDEGVQVWRLQTPKGKLGWIAARYRLFRMVAKWAKDGEVDLVEVPDYQGGAAGWGRLPVPVVGRLHGSSAYFAAEMGWRVDRLSFWLERASLRRCDFIASTSQYTADRTAQVFGLGKRQPAILHNPVELRDSAPVKTRSRNEVVFTGSLNAKKGVVSLIRAWKSVRQACPDAELHVFGKDCLMEDGSSMTAYLTRQLNGRHDSVHFHGHTTRDRLLETLRRPRVAVFPSYVEAFAMAPLEAMAQGCPTIYTNRGSGPELIDHGISGLLVDPDRPEEIANAIIRVLRDDDLAARLGEGGRRRVTEAFSAPLILDRNEAFYRSAIEKFHG